MRAIWSGAISFGLVNIPVKAYSASISTQVDLDMLDREHLAPIRYARVSTATGEEIPYEQIVKGYKYHDEKYVVLEKEDFEQVQSEKTKAIDILDFVEEKEVESLYYEKPYYLEPGKMATKAYSLLKDALTKSKRVGVALFVFRNKAQLGVVKPYKNVILLNQIRYESEIRTPDSLKIPETKQTSAKELEMAMALIDRLTSKFDPSKYKDTYTDDLMKLIEKKASGKPVKGKAVKREPTKVKDLAALLRASLSEQKGHRRRPAA